MKIMKTALPGALAAVILSAAVAQAQEKAKDNWSELEKRFLFNEQHAIGDDKAKLPEGAARISEAELRWLYDKGALSIQGKQALEQSEAAARETRLNNMKLVSERLRPELLRRFTVIDPNAKRSGENILHEFTDNRGAKQTVELMGEEFIYAELAHTLRSAADRTNQLNLYQALHKALPDDIVRGAPTLKQLSNSDLAGIRESISALSAKRKLFGPLVIRTKPMGYPASCSEEVGAVSSTATTGDRTGNSCAHHADGIYSNVHYPLKWYATCVRNQGNRGTCVSFGVTSTFETMRAVKDGIWYNFSEQHLYNAAKMKWYPSTYGDGLNTPGIMFDVVNRKYNFTFESMWDYNPSYSRLDNKTAHTYTNSCNNYTGEHCSDTNHQGKRVCLTPPFELVSRGGSSKATFCYYTELVAETLLGGTTVANLWSLFDTDTAVSWAKALLEAKYPMVMGLSVVTSFDGASGAGYVTYNGPGETSRGGHAVAVLGYVDNADLPTNAPQGSGGGYFIIKNSWGACWKDAGYVYLPVDWVKTYAYSLTVLTAL
jgi:C1A family cysteine protease